jgi:hypothetical protein
LCASQAAWSIGCHDEFSRPIAIINPTSVQDVTFMIAEEHATLGRAVLWPQRVPIETALAVPVINFTLAKVIEAASVVPSARILGLDRGVAK